MSGLPVPFGWFQVGWPEELSRGGVRPLLVADRHLTLWRDEDGVARLHDAYCPHLGAHLGHRGRVHGRSIVCPLHGRRFDAAGRNVHLPSGAPDERCTLRSHPVVERNGLLLAWIHPDGAPPAWEIPDIPELADHRYTVPQRREFEVASAWQEMAENGADRAHFAYVHGQQIVPTIDSYETDGPISRMRSTQRWPTADGVVDAFVDATSYGPGFSVIRMTGVIDTVSIGCNTPVSTDRCHLRFSFAVGKTGDEAMTALVGDAFIDLLTEQIGEDIRIWEHKRYLPHPALAPGEGPIMQFRSWASQFYAQAPTPAGTAQGP